MVDDEVLLASSSNTLDNDNEILPAFNCHILGNEILSTSGSHVLSDEKLSDSGLQVLSICPVQQESTSRGPSTLGTNDIENTLNNDNDINKQQNVEFNDQRKLEIAPGLKFQTWNQLDHYIKIYTKQNRFVSIIVESESDDNTCRRCRYACEHQGIGRSKKTAIVEN
ncbi:hypothetical protein C2G38_2189452 [Gigaspora rosea]|uniref:FAR1 domain-containing protein n=1 Tax=Gigaspora rosea TaxID=44941 RepID=A0A397V2I7_9GLOM|nr:hypothetical protein C2G38_2189452 [Gigaspora rosea]